MNRKMTDRQLKIALLRSQAAVERELVVQYAASARVSVSRVTGWGQGVSAGGLVNSLLRIGTLSARHPVLASTLSAWLLRGKRSRWLRVGGIALLAWRLFGAMQDRR